LYAEGVLPWKVFPVITADEEELQLTVLPLALLLKVFNVMTTELPETDAALGYVV
jgi:hypothetical protein